MNATDATPDTHAGREIGCMLVRAPWMRKNHLGIPLLRLCVGAMMLTHGFPKLLMLLQGRGAEWLDPLGMGSTFSLILCIFAEFVCSIAIILGFMTRLAALVLAFNFWVVVFVVDNQAPWAQTELALLYLVCFATLVCTGAGRYSLDRLLFRHCGCAAKEASCSCHHSKEL